MASSPRSIRHDPVRVLYIAGWGRSGTTILDTILGAHEGVFSAGELHYLWERGFLEERKCGCGLPLRHCPLWTEVLRAAFGDDVPDPRHVVDLQRRVVRLRHTPGLLRGHNGRRLHEYLDITGRLYRAIGEVSGDAVVVDSSKRPSDAAVLARLSGIEGYLVHVVRDPRAVAFSWQRQKAQLDRPMPADLLRHGAIDSTVSWVGWNLGTEAIARTFPAGRYHRLRYEDFARAPRSEVGRILELVGIDAASSPFADETTVTLPANHTASGNPNRFRSGPITIRVDNVWEREQKVVDRRVTTGLAAPWLGRYGYATRVNR